MSDEQVDNGSEKGVIPAPRIEWTIAGLKFNINFQFTAPVASKMGKFAKPMSWSRIANVQTNQLRTYPTANSGRLT